MYHLYPKSFLSLHGFCLDIHKLSIHKLSNQACWHNYVLLKTEEKKNNERASRFRIRKPGLKCGLYIVFSLLLPVKSVSYHDLSYPSFLATCLTGNIQTLISKMLYNTDLYCNASLLVKLN